LRREHGNDDAKEGRWWWLGQWCDVGVVVRSGGAGGRRGEGEKGRRSTRLRARRKGRDGKRGRGKMKGRR